MGKKITNALLPGRTLFFALFLIFALAGAFYSPLYAATGVVICVAIRLATWRETKRQKARMQDMISAMEMESGEQAKASVIKSPLPAIVATATTAEIIWANDAFGAVTGQTDTALRVRLNELAPSFETRWLFEGKRQMPGELKIGKNNFFVFGSMITSGTGRLMLLYFVDCTELVRLRVMSQVARPAIAIISIDNYEELLKNASDSEKSTILAGIDRKLSDWTKDSKSILRKFDRDRYIFVIENAQLDKLIARKFSVLQEVREIQNHEGVLATLSIGIGRDGETLEESYQYAGLATDMALSRGGDQAVVKNHYNFEFYGGRSEEVEKRTKVKSRVVANALSQLIRDSSQVLVMGHKNSDMDAIGAAAGIVCAARNKGKTAHIVIDRYHTMAAELIERLEKLPEYENVFISAEQAMVICDFNTLLVVVDVNRPGYVESESLLQSINKVAVIDHHRRAADYIENSVVNLHEPYASSASELVAELLQYMASTNGILHGEAEALLAGIYLDTKMFATRTGVRTFEAAAYLRRAGADVTDVKRLFQFSFRQYMERQKLIALATTCADGIIMAVSDEECNRIAAAQAADELLSIIGTRASIVAFREEENMIVSARSAGEVNVQMLMERLGGGGSLAAAGAQLPHTTAQQARGMIINAVRGYLLDQTANEKNK